MAVVEMEHLTIVGHQSEMPGLIHHLSNEGALEIERDEELEAALAELSSDIHGYRREIPGLNFEQAFRTRMAQLADPGMHPEGLLSRAMMDYPRYIAEAGRLIELLDRQVDYCDELVPRKTGFFKTKRKVAPEDYQKLSDRQTQILEAAVELENLHLGMDELSRDRAGIEQQYRRLVRWAGVPIPAELRGDSSPGTEHIALIYGIFRDDAVLAEVDVALKDLDFDAYSYEVLGRSDESITVLYAVHRDERAELQRILQNHGLELPPELPSKYNGDFKAASRSRGEDLMSVEEQLAAQEAKARILAEARPTFEILADFYRIQRARMIGMERVLQTPNLFVLSAWCPKKKTDALVLKLERDYTFALDRRDPLPDEEVPTLLENTPIAAPFEELVLMFSPPRYGIDIDPSALLSLLYSFFFGMMLSDAGYGLALMILTGVLVRGFKVRGTMRKMCLILFGGGIFAVFWGVLFGSYFGNLPSVISGGALNTAPLYFDPMQDPMKLMILSMLFGLIHLFIGMAVKIYMLTRSGNVYEALTTVVPWYLILIGIVLFAATPLKWALYLIYLGIAVILFLTPGSSRNPVKRFFSNLISLYNITSFLGDILSYTRILALTLATAVIALVVNILLDLVGLSFPGIIIGVVILLFGHTLNLALSGLSAYVHAVRLHYVEFFGRFYEGVGRLFEPFDLPTKYTEPQIGTVSLLSGRISR